MFTFGLIDLTSFPPTHNVCSSCTVPQPIADALQLCPPPPTAPGAFAFDVPYAWDILTQYPVFILWLILLPPSEECCSDITFAVRPFRTQLLPLVSDTPNWHAICFNYHVTFVFIYCSPPHILENKIHEEKDFIMLCPPYLEGREQLLRRCV